ncbi:serine/threonine-protein kinase [Streptomyces sp. NEAU-Y11]|uniref:serine/threonine-protein kinase n=1 Tax=Streptomyces cucumeris TaxID=2962890 RepID=UPI0020C8F00E|nr:serine/threonine-protein kinase [Streptomyces sp. NEAU-Y11]MCP9211445.1 serine/threonine protein kinase [Streptomyces sp. NEAU-Y11]
MNEIRELLADYGQWRRNEAASDHNRTTHLARIVVALLRRSVPHDSVHLHSDGHATAVEFEFEGWGYVLRLVGKARWPESHDLLAPRSVEPGARWAGLWFEEEEISDELVDRVSKFRAALLAREHLEAAVAGVRPLADLIRDAFRRRHPYQPLAVLLAAGEPNPAAWAMTPMAQLTSPPVVEIRTWAGTGAEVLLAGPALESPPTGVAVLPDRRALVTVPEGLLALDTTRGHAHWHLVLPGCHGPALVGDDGAVMVMCGSALVRWYQGQLSVVAGGFEEGAALLPGPGREPWVLSGYGVTFGAGHGTLALTRAGDRTGDQMRYPITFNAAVLSAVWLGGRRFFLAGSGSSAVVDLTSTTHAGQREDWITTPVHFPDHALPGGADTVLLASPDGSGNRISLHRTDSTTRTSEPLVEAQLGKVLGLTEDNEGAALLLASLPDNDMTHTRPALLRITGHRARPSRAPAAPAPAAVPADHYDTVRLAARGERRDYRLDPRPIASTGGQGVVFRATHKPSGTLVAFKKRRGNSEPDARRMRREVLAAQTFGGNPHVMPVLDFSPTHDWFVMPLAEATVEGKRSELQDPDRLRALVEALAKGLTEGHRAGWIHRDIKPANVLLLHDRWVVADWGLVRRPRGETSTAGPLTGAGIGTEGFAAPELSEDGHDIAPASDIYSIGQLIGWILTGKWPKPNVALLPGHGPWHGIVRQATQPDPAHRPQDMTDFLDLVERETAPHAELPILRAQHWLAAVNNEGDTTAAAQLLALAADLPGNYELYLDAIVGLSLDAASGALLANTHQATVVVRALTDHARGDESGTWPSWDEADRAVCWLLGVARLAAREEQWELLDAAVQGTSEWDGRHDRWAPRNEIEAWMRGLSGQAANVVASALRTQPHGAFYLHELADDRQVAIAIRSAIHRATAARNSNGIPRAPELG